MKAGACKGAIAVGIDSGGTSLRIAASDGRNLWEATSPGINFLTASAESATRTLKRAWARLRQAGRLETRRVASVCLGGAGLGRPAQRRSARRILQALWPRARLIVTDDATIALYTAFGPRPGMVLIAGTGSLCLGRNSQGDLVRAGGWGPLCGDPGSAYALGRRALLACLKARDGLAPEPSFYKQVFSSLGVKDPKLLEEAGASVTCTARLAQVLLAWGARGEKDALSLIKPEVRALVRFAEAVARKLKDSPPGLALAGGLLRNRFYLSLLKDALGKGSAGRRFAGVKIFRLRRKPVLGAVEAAEEAMLRAGKQL